MIYQNLKQGNNMELLEAKALLTEVQLIGEENNIWDTWPIWRQCSKLLPGSKLQKDWNFMNDFFENWMMYDVVDLPSYLDRSEFFTEYNKSLLKTFSKAKIDIDFIDYICDDPRRALTPLGFYTAIILYTNGYLEASQNKIKSFDLSKAVHDYVSLFNIGLELKRKEDAYQVRYRKMIDKPEMVLESEFNYSLLNAIFFEKVGAFVGSKELIIGNLLVTKFVSTPYLSNSGKSKDHEVVFNWLSESGKLNVINKSSRYENNRRNQSEA